MKTKMNKEKVKQFYEDHKALCIGVGVGSLIFVGEIIGWKCAYKANGLKRGRHVILHDDFNRVLADASKQYKGGKCSYFYTYNDIGDSLKINELGKLADICDKAGYVHMDQELTHIIAIGKPIVEK